MHIIIQTLTMNKDNARHPRNDGRFETATVVITITSHEHKFNFYSTDRDYVPIIRYIN